MQLDMHYYGTYAMARAAGLAVEHAKVVAYAAQYTDDSTLNESEPHDDGGMFETIATAHTGPEAILHAAVDHAEQRRVWIPFHFFPGGEGSTLSEKLSCVKDGKLAQEMVRNHIRHAVAVKNEYGLALMGITAHVYADTFSHYEFSGVSSRHNEVDGESFELDVKNPEVRAYIMGKFTGFLNKYTPRFVIANYRKIVSESAEEVTGALGHGGVGTYPDRPFLRWRFNFTKDNRDSGWRDNPATFLEACEKLHKTFNDFALQAEISSGAVSFDSIKPKVDEIIRLEADKKGRVQAWKAAIEDNSLFQSEPHEALDYSEKEWEQQKDDFHHLGNSQVIVDSDVYKFHQAAVYHRDYTLKQLLPKHGIIVL